MKYLGWYCISLSLALGSVSMSRLDAADTPAQSSRVLSEQKWERDTAGPVVELGEAGEFDDRHVFAPFVARDGGRYLMWYCGSRGEVPDRVFQLGLAVSQDGRRFSKHPGGPVLRFSDGRRSVLTATLLRNPDGSLLRENGRLRMWLSGTDFSDRTQLHTLHESSSEDGISWTPPSDVLLKNVYAPTVLKENGSYRMWYVDVSLDPWAIRYAESQDGRNWNVRPSPVLAMNDGEVGRRVYPYVIRTDAGYMMWFSYWIQLRPKKVAIGSAASPDGIHWKVNPNNPVFAPTAERTWESHYVACPAIVPLEDGSWRLWYASRKEPPFVNKYFAIGTALWRQPGLSLAPASEKSTISP